MLRALKAAWLARRPKPVVLALAAGLALAGCQHYYGDPAYGPGYEDPSYSGPGYDDPDYAGPGYYGPGYYPPGYYGPSLYVYSGRYRRSTVRRGNRSVRRRSSSGSGSRRTVTRQRVPSGGPTGRYVVPRSKQRWEGP